MFFHNLYPLFLKSSQAEVCSRPIASRAPPDHDHAPHLQEWPFSLRCNLEYRLLILVPEDSGLKLPKLGIVFLMKGRLFVASRLLADCEDLGEFKNYPGDHQGYWAELQNMRAVPTECEYDEVPRGRAVLNQATGKYSL